jgi:hypothetical protein
MQNSKIKMQNDIVRMNNENIFFKSFYMVLFALRIGGCNFDI